jgi:sulfur-oxidizing protein SoxX
MAGSRRSRPKYSAERTRALGLAAALVAANICFVLGASAEDKGQTQAPAQDPVRGGLRPYTVVGDAIPISLTGAKGDAERGRAIVVNRQVGLCLLCHSGPFPEERFQGTLAPDLKGAGTRSSEGQLRLRIVDASRLKPDTIMPSYYRVDGLTRVAPAFKGKPVLTAEQIEDVVAYLATMRE